MNELKLEIGKKAKLKNQYAYTVNFLHKDNGYYIQDDKQKFGPYLKILFERSSKHNNDIFITAYNIDSSTIYRVGMYGIEEIEVIDTSMQASKLLNKMFKPEIKIEGCTLLGTENGYSVFVDDCDDKFFVVNNSDTVKLIDEYEKFETYKSLVKTYRERGIRVYDQEIERLSKEALFIDFTEVIKIIKELKFDALSESLKQDIKMGQMFNSYLMDGSISKFLINKLKEDGKIKKIRKVHISDNNYVKKLEGEGIYRISTGVVVETLSYFAKNYPDKYEQINAAFEQKYYEMMNNVDIDEDTLSLIEKFLNCDISSYLAFRIRALNEENFTMEIFEWLLNKVYDNHKTYLEKLNIGDSINLKWLEAVSVEYYNQLLKKWESSFYVVKRFMKGEFDHNLEEFYELLNGRE